MNFPDTQLKEVLGRMADEAPEPAAFEALDVFQVQPDAHTRSWIQRPIVVVVATAVSVLLVGLATTFLFRSDTPPVAGTVNLPNDHSAAQILATSPTFDEFSEQASRQRSPFVCGAGGGPPAWEVCLMLDDGVLAVVPFAASPGLRGTLEGLDIDRAIDAPLDDGAFGVEGIELSVTLTVTNQGVEVGSVSGPAAPSAIEGQPAWDVSECVDPPAGSESESADSDLMVSLNVASARRTAGSALEILVELPEDYSGGEVTLGEGTTWQCWIEGEGWVSTHLLTKSSSPDQTEAVEIVVEGPTTANTVEAWGAPVPGQWWIRIPDELQPGIYQIAEPAWDIGGGPFGDKWLYNLVLVLEG